MSPTHVPVATKPTPEFVAQFLANLPETSDWSVFYLPTIGTVVAVPRFNDGEEIDERLLFESFDYVDRCALH